MIICSKRDIQSMDAGLALVLLMLLAHYFSGKTIFAATALVILLLCMTIPGIFKPFAKLWFGLSGHLSWFMSRLLLTTVFILMVVPVGYLRRLMGKDALKLSSWRSGSGSLLSERNHRYLPTDLERPY